MQQPEQHEPLSNGVSQMSSAQPVGSFIPIATAPAAVGVATPGFAGQLGHAATASIRPQFASEHMALPYPTPVRPTLPSNQPHTIYPQGPTLAPKQQNFSAPSPVWPAPVGTPQPPLGPPPVRPNIVGSAAFSQPFPPVFPGARTVGPPPPTMPPMATTRVPLPPPMSPAQRPPVGPPPPPPRPPVASYPSAPPSFVSAAAQLMAPPLPMQPPPIGPPQPALQPPQFQQMSSSDNSVNLLRERLLLQPHGPDSVETATPPPLGHPFPADANCDPDVMCCTLNAVPSSAELLRKCRLPLGLVTQPFKDLRSLPVIQASVIVRCQACRAYINPYVRFPSQRRWRCSLCYLENDLPEEFLYDPVSQHFGDPSRRPEIRCGTVEFVATQEYSVRPPPPATYIIALDVSQTLSPDPAVAKAATAYLTAVTRTLLRCLDQLPGDARTQLSVITFNGILHLYRLDGPRPRLLAIPDLDGDASLPTPEGLLVPISECRDAIVELLETLPQIKFPPVPGCCLGAALATAHRMAQSSGGRLLLFLASRPSIEPGALAARPTESDTDQTAGQPVTDYYKRQALEYCNVQLSVDLFCIGASQLDLASVMPAALYTSGRVHRYPRMPEDADKLSADLTRHLTRKLGVEAVLRIRCSNGYNVAAFYGSCFVRATDLVVLPCASPDAGFAVQLGISDGATNASAGSEPIVFQAALLYTGRKGDRRIRVHTLGLPATTRIDTVFACADHRAITGLLAQLGAERVLTGASRLTDARDALVNAAADPLAAYARASGQRGSGGLWLPTGLRLLPLLILALLKWPAFRADVNQQDERAAAIAVLRTSPLRSLLQQLLPSLYALHLWPESQQDTETHQSQPPLPPPRLQPSSSQIDPGGAYLLDAGHRLILALPASSPDGANSDRLQRLTSRARAFADRLRMDRPGAVPLTTLTLTPSAASLAPLAPFLIEDRTDSSMSYLEFLQYLQKHVLG